MKKTALLALSCIGILFSATAQDFNKPKLDSLLNTIWTNQQGMGSLAIAQDDKLVYQKAIGYVSMPAGAPVMADPQTKYRIGSISKMFTAVMIFQLIEENKLSLSTTLATYFPQVPNAAKITIAMMLSHRSGLHNFTDDTTYLTYNTKPHTEEDMLKIIAAQPSDFEPDSKPQYSNTNFLLLGYIVEKAGGKKYSEALKQRVTSKIGLTDTYYGGKINPGANEAASFTYNKGWQTDSETDMSIPGGAGAVVSTPTDLVKFIDALFAGKLVSAEHLELMKTIREHYGMAMFQIPFYDKVSFGHTGGIDGFSSMVGYFPNEKMAFAYIGNGVRYTVNDLLIGVLSIYFNKQYAIPIFKMVTLTAAQLDQYPGIYSSAQVPLKITVTKGDGTIMAQATGQKSFRLEPLGDNKFKYTPAGVEMDFDPQNHSFVLKQGGGAYTFTLDK